MTSPIHSPSERTQLVINSIEPDDVVLGRGNHIHIDGNTKFRQLVHARSKEYWSCQDNFAKDLIARQIVETVTSRGGRFLRKVRTSGEEDQWELANKETVLVKVKQTFRDFSASHRKQQSAAAASKSHSTNTASHTAAAAASMSAVGDMPNSLLHTEGESSTTTTSTRSAEHQRLSSRAALPSDFHSSRLNALSALPAPNVRELLLLRELRANQLNRIISNDMLHQLSPPAEDRSLQSWLEQAALLRLLPPSSSSQESSLLLSPDRQMSNFLSSRQFNPPPPSSLSNNSDVSELYRHLLHQRTEVSQRSIPSAASLLNLSSAAPLTTTYQGALQSLSVSRLLEELSQQQQQPSQQLQQLLAQERRQLLPSYFQSSIASTIASADRIPLLNLRSSQAPGLAANMGAMAAMAERQSEGKDQSPQSERKTAPPEEDSSGGEVRGTD
jgi:hypothetical protein